MEDEFDMSLFEDEGLELNLGGAPVEGDAAIIDSTDNVDEGQPNDSTEEENELPSESESSEEVAEEDDDQGNSGDSEQKDSPNIYSSFAKVLNEQGLLPTLDIDKNKINTVDELTEVLKGEIQSQSKQFIIDKVGKDGLEALERGISLSELQSYNETTTKLDSINEGVLKEDIELAKRIILQDYVNQGFDKNRAQRILDKSISLGDEAVIEDAVESLGSLKTFEKANLDRVAEQREQARLAEAAHQDKIDNDLKNAVYNSEEYVKGYKVTKAMQDKVYTSITKIVGQSPTGVAENQLMRDRRESPIEFDTKLYYLYELTNGFTDFSKVDAKSKSSATSELERALRQNRFDHGSGQSSFSQDPDSYGGFGSELVL